MKKMREVIIEMDAKKFRDYLEANGTRVLAMSLFVEVGGRERVCTLGNNEMVVEMAICAIAGMNGLTTVRK